MDFNKLGYWVNISDYLTNPVTDAISEFRYKFSETEDDVCEIELNSLDTAIADRKELKPGKFLTVQWGFYGGSKSLVYKVYIFDRNTNYQKDGRVNLKLICHERFAIAKMDAAANQNLEQLKDNTPIVFSTNAIKNVALQVQKGNTELAGLFDNATIGANFKNKGKLVSTYNGNMSTYNTLRKILDRLPGGPYVMDSRNDTLYIRTRDFKQTSHKSFTWKGGTGELLDFKPITKNRAKKSESDQITVNTYDPKTKTASKVVAVPAADTHPAGTVVTTKLGEVTTLDIYLAPGETPIDAFQKKLPKPKGPTYIPRYNEPVFSAEQIKQLNDEADYQKFLKNRDPSLDALASIVSKNEKLINGKDVSFGDTYKDFNNNTVDKDLLVLSKNTNNGLLLKAVSIAPSRGVTVGGAARDATAYAKNNFALVTGQTSVGKNIHVNDNTDKAEALADNTRKAAELDNNPGSAELLGQPDIAVGQIITILGVAQTHSGNYYIGECEHVLSDVTYELHIEKLMRDGVTRVTTNNKKGKKVNLYSLIPNNPNLKPQTPTIIINNTHGTEGNNNQSTKKVQVKTPATS